MRAVEAIRRSGVAVGPERTMREVAEIMESSGVGALAVIDGDHLVGIVTDRDLVRRGLARRLPPDARVDSLMYLVRPVTAETIIGHRDSPVPATTS